MDYRKYVQIFKSFKKLSAASEEEIISPQDEDDSGEFDFQEFCQLMNSTTLSWWELFSTDKVDW